MAEQKLETEVVSNPAVKQLHTQSIEEIGAFLANVVKSKRTLVSMTYVVGDRIELKYDTGPLNFG